MRGGTLYVEDEDAPEPPARGRRPRASTVLTALLVALGLALPGVAAFLLRPPPAPNPHTSETRSTAGAPSERDATSNPSRRLAPPDNASPRAEAPGGPPPVPASNGDGAPSTRRATRANPGAIQASHGAEPAVATPKLARLEPNLASTAADREATLRALLDDTSRPAEERSAAALELLDTLLIRGRTRALARDAERIFRMDLPPYLGRLPAEQAGWQWSNALSTLGEKEKVIEAGNAFLQRFPDSALAPVVGTQVRATATMLATEQRSRQAMKDELRLLEEELEQERARLERRGEPTTRLRFELARKHCSTPAGGQFYDVSVVTCRAFIDAWAPGTTPAERSVLRDAREAEIVALVRLRRYAEARQRLAEFRAADPEGERQTLASDLVSAIPPDPEE